jgi:hypothetical protein
MGLLRAEIRAEFAFTAERHAGQVRMTASTRAAITDPNRMRSSTAVVSELSRMSRKARLRRQVAAAGGKAAGIFAADKLAKVREIRIRAASEAGLTGDPEAATPFSVSDAHELISELDDVVDLAEEVADFMGLYRIEAATEQAIALADVLERAVTGSRRRSRCSGSRSTCARTSSRSTTSSTRATGSSATRSAPSSTAASTRWS